MATSTPTAPTPLAAIPATAAAATAITTVSAMAAPEATEPDVGRGTAHIVSNGGAPPASPPTVVAVTATSVGALATTADAERIEQVRVKIEPAAAQPRDGDVKKESTPPEDGGAGPRDNGGGGGGGGGGGREVAKPAGTSSTGGSSNPDGPVGCFANVRPSPPSLSEWLKEVRANRASPDGGVQCPKKAGWLGLACMGPTGSRSGGD